VSQFLRAGQLAPIRSAWDVLRSLVDTSKTSIRSLGYFYDGMLSLLQAYIPAIYSRYSDCIFVGVSALLIFLHLTTPSLQKLPLGDVIFLTVITDSAGCVSVFVTGRAKGGKNATRGKTGEQTGERKYFNGYKT
jgi:hypothetical protein